MLALVACENGESSFGMHAGGGNPGTTGPMSGGGTDEQHVRAEITLGDETMIMYDALSTLADDGCFGVLLADDDGSVEASYQIQIRWTAGEAPTLGAHPTGDSQGVDIVFSGGSSAGNIGPADAATGRGGTVTFDEFGDVVSGTFSGSMGAAAANSILSAASGTFRCVP